MIDALTWQRRCPNVALPLVRQQPPVTDADTASYVSTPIPPTTPSLLLFCCWRRRRHRFSPPVSGLQMSSAHSTTYAAEYGAMFCSVINPGYITTMRNNGYELGGARRLTEHCQVVNMALIPHHSVVTQTPSPYSSTSPSVSLSLEILVVVAHFCPPPLL